MCKDFARKTREYFKWRSNTILLLEISLYPNVQDPHVSNVKQMNFAAFEGRHFEKIWKASQYYFKYLHQLFIEL